MCCTDVPSPAAPMAEDGEGQVPFVPVPDLDVLLLLLSVLKDKGFSASLLFLFHRVNDACCIPGCSRLCPRIPTAGGQA